MILYDNFIPKKYFAYNVVNTEYNLSFKLDNYFFGGRLDALVNDGEKYYIAGDTDNVPEIQNVECDIALLPVGGTYTMNYKEAANLANEIKPKKERRK